MYFFAQLKWIYSSILFNNINEGPVVNNESLAGSEWGELTPLSPEDTLAGLRDFNQWFDWTVSLEWDRRNRLLAGTDLVSELDWTDADIAELSIDALMPGEDPNVGDNLDMEALTRSKSAIGSEIWILQSEINALWEWNPERVILEARMNLYNNLLAWIEQVEEEMTQWWDEEVSWAQGDVLRNGRQFANRRGEDGGQGIHENEAQVDELFWYGNDASSTAWCGGFVTKTCRESGFNVQTSHELRAKSFIECVDPRREKAHVFFMTPDGKALWGNQSDRVQIQEINAPIMWWVRPEDVWNPERTYTRDQNWPESVAVANIPAGAIVVTGRGWNT